MQHQKIAFLASDCESSRWVYNAIKKDFSIDAAIIEKPISKKVLFKGRIKRIGFFRTMGQVMFSVLVVPYLRSRVKNRRAELIEQYQLNDNNFDSTNTYRLQSVNDEACKQLLEKIQPDIILVNGTRIISKKILQSTNAVFINMHVGITPLYRGSHGGYWALYNNDEENFGTTIHILDEGVDTGSILKQAFITPTKKDNFTTYPILQVAEGIKILKDVLRQPCEAKTNKNKGHLYYQPTIWQYFSKRVR